MGDNFFCSVSLKTWLSLLLVLLHILLDSVYIYFLKCFQGYY